MKGLLFYRFEGFPKATGIVLIVRDVELAIKATFVGDLDAGVPIWSIEQCDNIALVASN